MDWKTIKEMRFELEENGYFVEVVTSKYFVLSKLKGDDKKLYFAYYGVYDSDGKVKVFDFNIKGE